MEKKKVVIALGHRALGNTLPEQKEATKRTAKIIAQLVKEGAEVVISHSNAPQVGMIHMAMNEFGKYHPDYTYAPMSVCSAMSQGYIGYDLQNAIRALLCGNFRFQYCTCQSCHYRLSACFRLQPENRIQIRWSAPS